MRHCVWRRQWVLRQDRFRVHVQRRAKDGAECESEVERFYGQKRLCRRRHLWILGNQTRRPWFCISIKCVTGAGARCEGRFNQIQKKKWWSAGSFRDVNGCHLVCDNRQWVKVERVFRQNARALSRETGPEGVVESESCLEAKLIWCEIDQ